MKNVCQLYPKLLVNVHAVENVRKSDALNYVRHAAHL